MGASPGEMNAWRKQQAALDTARAAAAAASDKRAAAEELAEEKELAEEDTELAAAAAEEAVEEEPAPAPRRQSPVMVREEAGEKPSKLPLMQAKRFADAEQPPPQLEESEEEPEPEETEETKEAGEPLVAQRRRPRRGWTRWRCSGSGTQPTLRPGRPSRRRRGS